MAIVSVLFLTKRLVSMEKEARAIRLVKRLFQKVLDKKGISGALSVQVTWMDFVRSNRPTHDLWGKDVATRRAKNRKGPAYHALVVPPPPYDEYQTAVLKHWKRPIYDLVKNDNGKWTLKRRNK